MSDDGLDYLERQLDKTDAAYHRVNDELAQCRIELREENARRHVAENDLRETVVDLYRLLMLGSSFMSAINDFVDTAHTLADKWMVCEQQQRAMAVTLDSIKHRLDQELAEDERTVIVQEIAQTAYDSLSDEVTVVELVPALRRLLQA